MKKFLRLLTGLTVSVAITVGLTLILAVFVKIFYLSSGFIKVANQIIKGVSVIIAVFFGVKEKGIILGLITGVLYAVITSVIFGFIGGNFSFGASFWSGIVFCAAVGGIFGIVFVNIKK